MNDTPLSFDQTGHTPNFPPVHSPGGPSLNNKRRSLADLLFVPTKIKAKRSSSSSVSSVDSSSYRQDETGQELSGNVNVGWSNHPKSASATSTTSTSSTGAMSGSAGLTITSSSNVPHHHYQQHHHQQQRMSLESQASPPARKSSTVKGVGKGTGNGGLGSSSSPKTFQCTGYPGCNMVFTRSEHLARHERKHTGEKPYKCIVANCPRTFSRYDNMIQHTQTHSDRTKRDSLAAVAAAASAAGVRSGPHSRSSSVQSTPLLPGRPRGGSSPVVFGPSWDEHLRRTQNNSPAASPYNASPAFSHHHQQQQQHHHPYSPHYQHHPQQQQQSHHPIQWSLPSGAPAGSSPALPTQHYSHHHGAESHTSLPGYQSSSTPVVRTLKANSRSLPHLQARASPMAPSSSTADSPSVGLQQSMSTMEIEELKRRKSEVLLPSSFSGARAASSTSTGYDQGIGLGMSPFIPTTSHPQSLPQVEKLTSGEQERLNEHRRSAQAMFFNMNAGREGSMDTRRTPEYSERPSSTGGPSQRQQHHHQPLAVNTIPSSGSTGSALPQVQQFSALEKGRLLEHRKSTPELMYDARMKRSSNDPTDMAIQPLPSRDVRSGMQWFSQISNQVTSSPRSSLTPREGSGGGGPSSVQDPGHSFSSSSSRPSSGDSSMILPPILGPYEEPQRDRQDRLRSHSSHIHPLSTPSTQLDSPSLAQFSSSEESKDQRQQFGTALSPRLERHWEEQYFPIRKRHVVETIEQMDSRDFLGLKYQVAEHYANEQFRNPEFLGNMTAILCVIRAPHTAWKGGERRQGSQGSVVSASEHGSSFTGSRRTSKDMEVDEAEQRSMAASAATKATVIDAEEGASAVKREPMSESMDVDDGSGGGQSVTTSKDVVIQPCRFALDIDVDSFSRDPEPSLRGFESLTINSLFPTRSFVAGFEDTPAESHTNASEKERYLSTHNGYPSNSRLGRFYLPERSYRTPESLATQPDPNDRWVCCKFEEYHGMSIWVLESVLDKYHEISRRHKMALTLVGATVHHREAVYSREDWEIHSGEQYEVKSRESVLYPEMIHQVWRDMYHQHHQRTQYQHQQQQHAPPMPQVATYEEYQRSLMQSDPRRDSYQPQQQQQQQAPPRDRTGPYYSYSDYRQQQQSLHREDLSSAPSSPQSPRHDDFPDGSPQHHHQQYQQHQRQGSSASASANMHRRISIAELCNPMQSLATERAQRREETASKRTSM
ncbi:hypothetical protein BGX30_006404 [Mortierella sp. GBA39]|nr:hypothetical protein BGX30_006404 [Mortierella sp. GBA39]